MPREFAVFALVATVLVSSVAATGTDAEGHPYEIAPLGMEDTFTSIIEEIKKQLRQGIPEKNIPPMDPLDLKYQEFDLNFLNATELKGFVKDVTGHNILAFNVTKLKVSIMPVIFEARFEWAPIDVKGYYDIDGSVISVIPIYGNGTFRGDFEGIFGYIRLDVGTKAGELRVKKFELDFGIKNVTVEIENFLGGLLGNIICEMINENLPTMVEQFKVGYLPGIKQSVMEVINEFLKGKTIDDILDLIYGLFPTTTSTTTTTETTQTCTWRPETPTGSPIDEVPRKMAGLE